jgi:hypothetical protein
MVTRYKNSRRSLRYVDCTDKLVVTTDCWEWALSQDQLETITAILVLAVPPQPREASVAFVAIQL